jgi:TetR/AcrR family transcriptional repressor of nem operon
VSRRGEQTREKILDVTQDLTLRRGFGATSIDLIIDAAGLTKGAFFYHFRSKNDLARALVERFAEVEKSLTTEFMEKAERLARDPLQQLLLFIGLFEELFRDLDDRHPGCLFATFCYESELNDEHTNALVRSSLLAAREMMVGKLQQVMEAHPPKVDFDVEAVADLYTGVFEGAFVLARALEDPAIVARQLAEYRRYLELLFTV